VAPETGLSGLLLDKSILVRLGSTGKVKLVEVHQALPEISILGAGLFESVHFMAVEAQLRLTLIKYSRPLQR
jgi:hypothetical protein